MILAAPVPPATRLKPILDAIRSTAPYKSPDVRRILAFTRTRHCRFSQHVFAAGVDTYAVMADTPYAMSNDQSPFAIIRGTNFEYYLKPNNFKPLRDLLAAYLATPSTAFDVRGLVFKTNILHNRYLRTCKELLKMLRRDPDAYDVLVGAVLRQRINGEYAYFELDFLACALDVRLYVGEVKSYPVLDKQTDCDKLGETIDQAIFYQILLADEIAALGFAANRVADTVLLVNPYNTTMSPCLSEMNTRTRRHATELRLARLPNAVKVACAHPMATFQEVVNPRRSVTRRMMALAQIMDTVGTDYQPGCIPSCGFAHFCRARAALRDDPCRLGAAVQQATAGINDLRRAADLSRGAPPTPAEKDAAALLARAGALYDAYAVDPALVPVQSKKRTRRKP